MANQLFKGKDQILRCLETMESKCLVIDCIKKTMPHWVDSNLLKSYEIISEEELLKSLNVKLPNLSDLTQPQIKKMHLRYGTISACLTSITNESERKLRIFEASRNYKVSMQTIRHRLCDYLVFQNIVALAPRTKSEKELNESEKNFRWALNKYFYKSKKLSLKQAFKILIKERYTDFEGKILQNSPKFHQFKYFYYKNRNESNFIISRLGRGEYDKNYRPLLGDSVRDFCPSIGYGMLDSTTCDIYLVNEQGQLIGRPILATCIDGYSGMCLGYSIGWQGGIESLRKLMRNVISDKIEWCRSFGIEIKEEDWNSHWIPHKLITDMGKEYTGDIFSQLTDLGIEFINLEPYRPELKSLVERFFGLIQDSFKKELINKGVVLKDFGDRGAIDYRKNACLTLKQFEKIIILCIIHYNCGRAIELPYSVNNIKNHSRDLWNHCLALKKDNLIEVDREKLDLTLMPRCKGQFKRNGLWVNKLRYKATGFTNDYLKGRQGIVAYNPDDVSQVWLIRDGSFIKFDLIEKFFEKMSCTEAKEYKNKGISKEAAIEELESEIKLSKEIEIVSISSLSSKASIKHIRDNRKKEIRKNG